MSKIDRPFSLSMRFPRLKSRERKDGMVYLMEVEIPKEDWDYLAGLDRTGMVMEAEVEVTHCHAPANPAPADAYVDKPCGPLCQRALNLCETPEFQAYLMEVFPDVAIRATPHFAAKTLKQACQIDTRKALDYDKVAQERFRTIVKVFDDERLGARW